MPTPNDDNNNKEQQDKKSSLFGQWFGQLFDNGHVDMQQEIHQKLNDHEAAQKQRRQERLLRRQQQQQQQRPFSAFERENDNDDDNTFLGSPSPRPEEMEQLFAQAFGGGGSFPGFGDGDHDAKNGTFSSSTSWSSSKGGTAAFVSGYRMRQDMEKVQIDVTIPRETKLEDVQVQVLQDQLSSCMIQWKYDQKDDNKSQKQQQHHRPFLFMNHNNNMDRVRLSSSTVDCNAIQAHWSDRNHVLQITAPVLNHVKDDESPSRPSGRRVPVTERDE